MRKNKKCGKLLIINIKSMSKTVGIILTWNSGKTLAETYRRIPKDLLDEVIVSDDGSDDNTAEEARRLGLKFFTHPHGGYGANIKFGLKKALELGADYMVEIHGDGQYSLESLPQAISKMEGGCDFLLGSRFTDKKQALKNGMPLSRYLANRALSFFDRLLLNLKLTEFHTGFRVYSRRLMETVGFKGHDDYLYSFEIIVQAVFFKLKICETPVQCDYRKPHTSISIFKSAIYSFQTFYVLLLYWLAKLGLKKADLFKRNADRN